MMISASEERRSDWSKAMIAGRTATDRVHRKSSL
jgi:hypothetical protein